MALVTEVGTDVEQVLPAPPLAAPPVVLSDALADRVGDLLAASEAAADAIQAKAQVDAEALTRVATQHAVLEAQRTAASLPELEGSVSELRQVVDGLREDVERLKSALALVSGEAKGALPPPERAELDRRALLIAFNMATNGATRDETARYLAEHLELDGCDALLDTVYSHVNGT